MADQVDITEYLAIDLPSETWLCRKCGHKIGPARRNYKEGLLVAHRDPREVHNPVVAGEYGFAPDPTWCRIVEFYCPGCATLVENEYLPPGHPITHDIELDIDALKAKHGHKARPARPASRKPAARAPSRSKGSRT
jgi:acetone carboxylase gamma subunit